MAGRDESVSPGSGATDRLRSFAHVSFHSMAGGQAAAVHVTELFDALRRRGLDGVAINRPSGDRSRWIGYLAVLMRALLQVGRVDVLYVRAHPAALPLVAAARLRRGTTIVEVNGTPADMIDAYPGMRPLRWLIFLADRTVLRLADGIATVSPGLRDWVRSHTSRTPVAVIPNAADRGRFHTAVTPRAGLPRRYVAYCGALAPWQGLDTLIEATTHPRWPSGVRLVVAGAGPLRAGLATAASARAPVDDLGVLPHHEIPAVMAGALAVLSTRTHRDASPMKLYEALACGTPVVASAIPGQVEIVESRGCGLTFSPSDPGELAAAVAAVADDANLRARLAACARVVGAENSWDARAGSLLAFVRNLTGGG